MPRPRAPFDGEAPGLVDLRALADVGGDVAQGLQLRRGQHQIIPVGDRLDALRQIVQPRAGLTRQASHSRRLRIADCGCGLLGAISSVLDRRLGSLAVAQSASSPQSLASRSRHPRLNCETSVSSLPLRRARAGRARPATAPLFRRAGLVDIQAHDLTRRHRRSGSRLATRQHAAHVSRNESAARSFSASSIEQQGAATQRGSRAPRDEPMPRARQRSAGIGGAQHVQLHAQRRAGEGGHRALARAVRHRRDE